MPLRTLEDLGDLAGRRVFVRLRLQRPAGGRRDHRRPPHPGHPADADASCSSGGASLVAASHLGPAEGSGRRRRCGWRPVAERLAELAGPRGRVRPDRRRRQPRGRAVAARRWRRAGPDRPAGEPAVRSRRGGERPGVRAAAGRLWPTPTWTTRSAPCTARTRAWSALPERHQRAGRAVAGRLLQREVEVLSRLLERSGAAVRRGARRGQGLRQARHDRRARRTRGRAADRRGDGVHVHRRRGRLGSGTASSSPTGSTRSAPRAPERTSAASLIQLPEDVVAAPEPSLDADRHTVPADDDPGGPDGPRHRPADRRGVRADDRRRQDHPVERADGGVRARAVRAPGPAGSPRRSPARARSRWSAAATASRP